MRALGVNILSADALSIIVSTFIACRVTIRLRAPCGMGVYVCGAGDPVGSLLGLYGGNPCGLLSTTLVMGGTAPGVLFLVTRRCRRFVPFSARLDVGFLDFIIGGASVTRGIVIMGVSSITLCPLLPVAFDLLLFHYHPLFIAFFWSVEHFADVDSECLD